MSKDLDTQSQILEPVKLGYSADKAIVSIIGLVGSPGSGKGTQCDLLARTFALDHISVGDILRAEMTRPGGQYSNIIRENMFAGRVGPKEITVELPRRRITESAARGVELFVLDSSPYILSTKISRVLTQEQDFREISSRIKYFIDTVGPISRVIVLECSNSTVIERLNPRGRFDDTSENIQKRLDTFRETTGKVINAYEEKGQVERVDAELSIQDVHAQLSALIKNLFSADRE